MSELELWEIYRPINLLKVGVGSPFLVKFPLMEVWNIWAFLTSPEPVGPFGLIIYWLSVLVGETVVTPPTRTGELNLGDLMGFFHPVDSSRPYPSGLRPQESGKHVRRVRDGHLRSRRLARMRSPSTSRNPICNMWVNRQDDHQEGPVDQ